MNEVMKVMRGAIDKYRIIIGKALRKRWSVMKPELKSDC
jgi:hypothetical protein